MEKRGPFPVLYEQGTALKVIENNGSTLGNSIIYQNMIKFQDLIFNVHSICVIHLMRVTNKIFMLLLTKLLVQHYGRTSSSF